ncbi:hypothetical protein F5Y19DRAFT_463838 [Xylariaceae sp. FL1651]|nr:hypothetical protein F5Y19DRAFT_463838 [Xylariaceae sp. FL1651]
MESQWTPGPDDPRVAYTLERAFPEWAARTISEATGQTAAERVHNEPMEFLLSSNWVLRPEGLKDFYNIIFKIDKSLEIAYDPGLHGFKIQCLTQDEARMVTLVKSALDELVLQEIDKGLDMSTKIVSIEDWRKKGSSVKDGEYSYDKYCFPCDILACKIRSIWVLPDSLAKKGVTTKSMLPGSALSKVQRLTGAKLTMSCNGRLVYMGASTAKIISLAKQKLDTLAKFFSMAPLDTTQVVGIFLHGEGDNSSMGEYRYLADRNIKLLQTYVLDRWQWYKLSSSYALIFAKGAVVRLNPANRPWKEAAPLSATVLPAMQDGNSKEEFDAFRPGSWSYKAKEPHIKTSLAGSDVSAVEPRPENLRAQAQIQPKIDSWVSSLPPTKIEKADPRDPKNDIDELSKARKADQLSVIPSHDKDNSLKPSLNRKEKRHSTCSVASQTDGTCSAVRLQQSQPATHDPFEHLWMTARTTSIQTGKTLESVGGSRSNLLSVLSTETLRPQAALNDERESRSFHLTMNQKAAPRAARRNVYPDVDPSMKDAINNSLASLMAPLTMWPGIVELRVEIGRLCFLNLKKSHIQTPEDDDDEKYYKLQRIQNELNKKHTANERLHFTQILTSLGADANYITCLKDADGNRLWQPQSGLRHSVYEFICQSRTVKGETFQFIVDIDAKNFNYRIRQARPSQNCFAVHCIKRVWDFRLVLSVSQNVEENYRQFANDLVRSLRVKPGKDRLPELEVTFNRSYHVDILIVRTLNIAGCTSEMKSPNTSSTQDVPLTDALKLEISEVWEMEPFSEVKSEHQVQLKYARQKSSTEPLSTPSMWYEASICSKTITTALEQNLKLELGNETGWTVDELLKSGAIDGLICKAADMVKLMDGVGYWNDNHQEELMLKGVPVAKSARGPAAKKFW